MIIGDQIQCLRVKHGLTQERLAEMLEVSRQSVSKWELGQAMPDVEKIIRMSELFEVSTDTILMKNPTEENVKENPLHLGSVYLVVKDFERSVAFYESFFGIEADGRCQSGNKFVNFYIDGKCISLMNESNLIGHCTDPDSPYKFVQNYWVEDLMLEYKRIKELNIGNVTEIRQANPAYYYFHLTDPDNNIIEITGGYHMNEKICQSCGMPIEDKKLRGTEKDGSESADYCCYCYKNGAFSKDETMEEMIESCIPFMLEDGSCKSGEDARNALLKVIPNLKRWKSSEN